MLDILSDVASAPARALHACHIESMSRHLALLVVMSLLASGVAVADIVRDIAPTQRTQLAGCWRAGGEIWRIRPIGTSGLEIVRTPADASMSPYYAQRAAIAREILFDTKAGSFAFVAAGRIHGLMMIFLPKGDALAGSWFTTHDGRSYVFTGNNVTMTRCQ